MNDKFRDPKFFKIILDSIADGVMTVDAKKRITSFNRAAEKITGVPASRALECKCYEVFQSDICQSGCALERVLEMGIEARDVPARIINSSGETIPVSISTAVLRDGKGKFTSAVESFRDLSAIEHLRKEITQNYTFEDIISRNRALNKIFSIIPGVAESESCVLIQGPSGSGRELLARAIHNLSPRAGRDCVVINCGTLPAHLFEAEVFGYVKGAFPEAKMNKTGKLAAADKGTVYFNEIGELPLSTQVKIQRLLQTGEYEPLGTNVPHKINVRVIASTIRDLKELVAQGRFRDDLYFRLAVVKFEIPPLRDRREDIPYLVEHFIHRMNARKGKDIMGVSPEAMDVLLRYDFPGNIRELESVIEYAFAVCRGRIIELEHLPMELQNFRGSRLTAPLPARSTEYPDEPTRIRETLRRNNGHLGRTCAKLGFHRTTLWRKMKAYGISRSEFKEPR